MTEPATIIIKDTPYKVPAEVADEFREFEREIAQLREQREILTDRCAALKLEALQR